MTVSSQSLVEFVLLGPTNDRRQLQDSPVLGDVWIAFAKKPAMPIDLLITPDRDQSAGPVAVIIAKLLGKMNMHREKDQEAHVAYLQGLVAARLFFREVLRVIVPMTRWWRDRKVQNELGDYTFEKLIPKIQAVIKWAQARDEDSQALLAESFSNFTVLDRYVILAGIILRVGAQGAAAAPENAGGIGEILANIGRPADIVEELDRLFKEIKQESYPPKAQVFHVSLNRRAVPALERSVPAVKGDAARTLFKVKCDKISWAILDSGIDGRHAVFFDDHRNSRIIKAYDFSNIRKIVSLDNLNTNTPAIRRASD